MTAASTPLEGTLWRLVEVRIPAGTLAVPGEVEATIRFVGGRVSGRGGCNRFHGPYRGAGTEMTVGPVAATMMACPGDAARVESAYFAALGVVAGATIDASGLRLTDGSGGPVLSFVAVAEPSLTGPTWLVSMVNDGHGGVRSLVAGTRLSATFSPAGTVSGFGGVNTFGGPVSQHGPVLRIGPLAATLMAALTPGVTDQEASYLAALGRSTRWSIDGDRLELRDDDGALQVQAVVDRGPGSAAPSHAV